MYTSVCAGRTSARGSTAAPRGDGPAAGRVLPGLFVVGISLGGWIDWSYWLHRDDWTMNFNLTYNQSPFIVTDGTFPNIERKSHELLGEWTSFLNLSEKSKVVFGGTAANTRGREVIIGTPEIVVSDGALELRRVRPGGLSTGEEREGDRCRCASW